MNNHINFQHISNRIKLAENNHNWMTLNCQLIMVECYYTQKQMYRGLRLKVFSVMFCLGADLGALGCNLGTSDYTWDMFW